MAGNIKGIIVEIGGDTSGLQKALSKVNSATSSLSRELKGINSLLKLDPSNTILLSQEQEVLSENIEQTSKKLKELQKIKEQADNKMLQGGKVSQDNYRALQREIEATKNKLNNLKSEASKWTKVGEAMSEFGNGVTNISNKIDGLGTTLSTRLTLPIAALNTSLINAAKDFETAFAGVEKTVDVTADELEKLKNGIQDMAEELPSSTTEIAAVAEAAGQLGIATEDILDFTKVMIDLGNSTNLSAEEAASSLAKFANVTKMSAKNYDRLGATIVDLGNNFATTEADIVAMATRLASTGELAGLSEPQILALATAMSSVGIEAEAGGSAMSKLLKQIQVGVEVGGNQVQRFAKVAGMSVNQFKKAFEQDAVGALSAFISGLNDTERNGMSAIAILDKMDLKEVRLSNTILSLANASDVLNNAVETGNRAWNDNTALTNEANKRYETLDSQLEITKNKFKNLANNIGTKLTPKFKDILKQINRLIDGFDELTEEETENIVETMALVAAIGPTIKIVGKLGKATGNTITALGDFSKAIANVKNGVTNAKGTVGTLTQTISALVSPTGLAVAGITALTAASYTYAKKSAEQITSLNGVRDAIDSQIDTWAKLQEAREMSLSSTSNEIIVLEKLSNELNSIVDSNGKVKLGYEDRANFIVTTLNDALGLEMSLNNGIIKDYQSIQGEIDNVIEKKKAEILLNAYADEYAEALRGQGEATSNLKDLTTQMKTAEEEYAIAANESNKKRIEAQAKIKKIGEAIKEEQGLLEEYQYTIGNYEALQTASISGTAEQLDVALANMKTSWEKYQTDTALTVGETSNIVNQEVVKIASILQRDTTVPIASQNLGNNSSRLFLQAYGQNEQGTEQNLENIKTIIDEDTEVERASGDLGFDSSQTFKDNANSTSVGEDFSLGIAQGINNRAGDVYNSVHVLGQNMIAELRASINSHSPSREAMEVGQDFDDGFLLGIRNNKKDILKEISSLGFSSVESLSKNMLDFSNFEKFNSNMANEIIKSTSTIFTTPQIVFNVQELDQEKLEQCFTYINEKFGSSY